MSEGKIYPVPAEVAAHAWINDAYKSMAIIYAIEKSAEKVGRPVLVGNE